MTIWIFKEGEKENKDGNGFFKILISSQSQLLLLLLQNIEKFPTKINKKYHQMKKESGKSLLFCLYIL